MKSVQDIVEMASAYYSSALLFAAIDCDIFSRIEKGEIKADNRAMCLMLDALVAEGLLEKSADGVYSNTSASRLALIPGAPADLTNAIRYNRDVYPAWGKLAQFVKTSRPVEKPEIHLGEDDARTKMFASAMFSRAMAIGRGIVPMLGKLEGKALDLAGGPAAYAILMCKANPALKCTSVDLAPISNEAKKYVLDAGFCDCIECRAGDYHTDEYEEGEYDFVTLFGCLHQESPEMIVDILKRANKALKKGGKVFVLDMMTDHTKTSPKFSALFGLNMALTTENGWVFSDSELKLWMNEAGFVAEETLKAPPPMPHWLVVGEKI